MACCEIAQQFASSSSQRGCSPGGSKAVWPFVLVSSKFSDTDTLATDRQVVKGVSAPEIIRTTPICKAKPADERSLFGQRRRAKRRDDGKHIGYRPSSP